MENHPIPQDVTGFQFKLIGNMTVKQFAYVATGSVLAVVLYYSPLFVLLKFPLILLFALKGVLFAFAPVEGRPMDVMAGYFLKALFAPNQYLFHKSDNELSALLTPVASYQTAITPTNTPKTDSKTKQKQDVLFSYLNNLPSSQSKLDQKETTFLDALFNQQKPQATQPSPQQTNTNTQVAPQASMPQQPPTPAPQPVEETEKILENKEETIEKELEKAHFEETHTSSKEQAALAHERAEALANQLAEIAKQKSYLEQEVIRLKKELEAKNSDVHTPSVAKPQSETNLVRKVPQNMSASVGLPNVPDVPNILIGIVKDPRGATLPGILVEVKDSSANPIRAFRTNQLGQFASATPLANGTYTLEFEDPKKVHKFDKVEIVANGTIMMPLEIFSYDEREDLRRALFE